MKFVKMQGTGNDFVVIEPDTEPQDWSRLAVTMCDRHYGIGADGILLLLPSKTADFRMRIFNSDGSEAEICGNGLRCLVRYFVEHRLAGKSPRREISVETMTGMRKSWFTRGANSTVVRLGMGKPRFGAKEIPVRLDKTTRSQKGQLLTGDLKIGRRELPLNLISMGNPHAVYFSNKAVSSFPLSRVGPKIEHHRMFPQGTNFEVVRVVDSGCIDARVWERGTGETLACGSGACAAVVAARRHGYVGDKVAVNLPGGTLDIEWDGTGEVFLSGPAENVFAGEWPVC